MKFAPELSSGPWPCYVVDFNELAAIATAIGIGVSRDGQPVIPNAQKVGRIIDEFTEGDEPCNP